MDEALRNRLWDALTLSYWNTSHRYYMHDQPEALRTLTQTLWHKYFKEPLDTIPNSWPTTLAKLRMHFFPCLWNEAYDFIEFIANRYSWQHTNDQFMAACNVIMQEELSAYRFVGGIVTEITSEEEIRAIEEALQVADPLTPVRNHLNSALAKLADRKNPDYRNSVKESISAVEALCKLVTKNPKATLGDALKQLDPNIGLHSALKNAFSSLYGYTSDADGIRHALLDEPTLNFEDAKFMLVSCSAFINYLVGKASKVGIKL